MRSFYNKSLFTFALALVCCFLFGGTATAQTVTHVALDCAGPTTAYDSGGPFGDYSANENIVISYGTDNQAFRTVSLDFVLGNFDVDPSDTVYLYEGRGTGNYLVGKFNNNQLPPANYTSTTGQLTIQFISDGVDEGTGWEYSYSCATGAAPNAFACSTFPPTTSTDPAGSGLDYDDDTPYIESFRVDVEESAFIGFNQLDLAAGDSLFIYNGPDETYPLLGTLTDVTATASAGIEFTATGNDITIVFLPNGDGTVGEGWGLTAECVEDPNPVITSAGVPNICSLLGDTVVLTGAYQVSDNYEYDYAWEYATSATGPWSAAPSGPDHGNDSMMYKAGDVGFFRVITTRLEVYPDPGQPFETVEAGGPDTSAAFQVVEGPTGTAVRPSITPTDETLPDKEVIVCQNESVELAAQFQDPNNDLQLLWFRQDGGGFEQLSVTSDTLLVTNTGTNTGPGTYIVAALDPSTPGNCPLRSEPDQVQVTFIATPPPTVTVNAGGPTTFCKGGDVELTRSVAPAVLDVDYQWYRDGEPIPGATDIDYDAEISGNYTVEATNVCGDAGSNQVTVVVNDVPPVPVVDQSTVALCEFAPGSFSTETVNATYNAAGGSYNQQWQFAGSDIPGATDLDYNVNQPGTYTFVVENVSATSCASSVDVTVIAYDGQPDDPEIEIVDDPTVMPMSAWATSPAVPGGNTVTCVGDSIVLSAESTGFPAYNYDGMEFKWFFNGTEIGGATDRYYTATVAGTYTVRAFNPCDSSDNVSDQVTLSFNNPPLQQQPAITSQSTPTICNDGGNITLQTTDYGVNYSYQWNRVEASGGVGVGPVGTDDFEYDAFGSGVTADTAAYTVTVTHDITGCAVTSEPFQLDETDSFAYWANNVAAGTPGVTDAIELTFAVSNNPNAAGDIDTICTGDSTHIFADDIFFAGGASAIGPGTTLQWFLNGTPIPDANRADYWAKQAGTYTLEVNNACGSEVSNSVEIVEYNISSVSITPNGPLTFCAEDSVQLDATTSMVDPEYTWMFRPFGSTTFSSYTYPEGADTNFVVADAANAANGGVFMLKVQNDDACASSTVEVKIPPRPFNPQVEAGAPISTCQGQSVPLFTTDNTLDATYQWYIDTTGTPEAITAANGKNFSATASGVYTVVTTTLCGSASSQDFDVSVQSGISLTAPNVTVNPTAFCLGSSVDLVVNNPAGAGATYTWFYKENIADAWVAIPASNTTTLTVLDEGYYYVEVRNAANCVANSLQGEDGVQISDDVFKPAAPMIMANGNTEICIGDSVLLTGTVSANADIQWKRDGNAIAGATSSNIWVSTPGDYTLTIFEPCDSATSFAITVTNTSTASLPQPTVDPMNPILCQGSSQTFTATTSVANPQYQWYRNGTAIVGATFPTVSVSTPGTYTVEVTNFGQSACPSESMGSDLTFVPSSPVTPLIQSQDGFSNFKNPNICDGEEITFALISDAPAGATYQWDRNGVDIAGATDSTVVVTQAGNYNITITNACGSATSSGTGNTVTVSGTAPAAPTVSPATAAICQGNSTTLTAANTGGLDIQWLRNGLPITGATSATLTVTQAGSYAVRVDDNGCTNTSNNAVVSISTGAPDNINISANGATTFCEGGSVELETTSSLSGLNVEWLEDGTAVAGQTGNTLELNGLAAGTYTYELGVTNGCGGDTSNAITINVTAAPAAPTIDPATATICAGQSVTLTANGVAAGGSVQWLLQGAPVAGATANTLDATSAGAYAVEITVGGCLVTSADAVVSDGGAGPVQPTITASGPTDFCEGESVTLEIPNSNVTPQWQLDGADIAGANGFTYVADVAGDYTVNVENSCGTSSSANTITVTVTPGPGTPTISPANAALCDGEDVTLEATNAPAGATLQWRLNGTDIAGETGTTVTVSTAGAYTVVATDGCSSESAVANVTVVATPDVPTVTVSENVATISNFDANLSYQWLDANGDPIAGQTSETFTNNGQDPVDVTVVADDNGCTSESAVATVGAVGIADLIDVINVNVYPNPNDGRVVVDGAFSNATYTLYDNAGRVVANGELNIGRNELTFDVVNGVYNLYILDEQGQMNTKLVITD